MHQSFAVGRITKLIPFAPLATFCVLLLLVLSRPAGAQSPLRWKLEPGDSLIVQTQQHTTTTVSFIGKTATTQIDLGMTLRWTVTSADANEIKIKQLVERITFQLAGHSSAELKYDSAEQGRPAGPAREVADAVKPLIGAEVELTMNARGQIRSTRPVNAAAEKLLAAAGADEKTGVFSPQAMATLLRQSLLVLPEQADIAPDSWTETTELKAAAGVFEQATIYRLAGQAEADGETVERIVLSGKLTPKSTGTSPAKLTVKSHEQSGSILFSKEKGRLVSAEQTQKLTTERPYRETTIVVTLESKQTTTVRPAEQP
jgi:hypothetical protein